MRKGDREMKPSEFKKAITLLRDCENKIDFIVHLYEMVDEDTEQKETTTAAVEKPKKAVEKKTGKAAGPKAEKAEEKKSAKAAGSKDVKVDKSEVNGLKWKKKKCEVCGKIFQPKNNRDMRCKACKKMTVEDDIKNTAAELAATMK